MVNRFARKIKTFLASTVFFRLVLLVFIFEALWIVFSAIYPMAFDEDFHFGIIRIYSHHVLPFLPNNVAPSGTYGAVARDPSYLYHYLMSFPYRLVAVFTSNEAAQIIFLRLINVALFGGALVLFRRLLLRGGLSRAFAHVALLLFVLIPIVPLVAAQINYDNLLILLVAWLCLLACDAIKAVQKRTFPLKTLAIILVVCVAASLVKYAFLPIFAAIVLVLTAQTVWTFRGNFRRTLWPAVQQGYRAMSRSSKIGLIVAFLVFSGLFMQRYGVNAVVYHNPIPACDQVLTVQQCRSYGPYGRDYLYAQSKGDFQPNRRYYAKKWLKGMWLRIFFVINGNVASAPNDNIEPLPLPKITAAVITIAGLALVIFYGRTLFHGNWLNVLLLAIILLYCAALYYQTYKDYTHAGQVVAVNGRYLLMVMVPAMVLAGRALELALRKLPALKVVVSIVAIVLFLQGGIFEFIVQSDHNWYWPNTAVYTINDAAQDILEPLAIGTTRKSLQ